MVFESLSELLTMCNQGFFRCHGVYVWSSYALVLSVIIYNFLAPILEKKRLLKEYKRRRARETL